MEFKLTILSVACLALLFQPAYSGNILSEGTDTVTQIVSLVPNLMKAKATAAVKAAADMAGIFATGLGLEVRTLGKASSEFKGAMSDGLFAIGDSITRAGNTASGVSSKVLVRTPVVKEVVEEVKVRRPALVEEVKMVAPTVVEEEYVVPYEQEVVEIPMESFPIRSVKTIAEPSRRVSFIRNEAAPLWNLFGNAGHAKINGARIHESARSPVVYEIINEPRVYPGPLVETFQFQKK